MLSATQRAMRALREGLPTPPRLVKLARHDVSSPAVREVAEEARKPSLGRGPPI